MLRPIVVISLLSTPFATAQKLSGLITEAHDPATGIRGAVIRISQPGAERLAAELETGHDGRFLAAIPLPAGDYRIEIRKPHHASAMIPIRLPVAAPLNVQLTRYGTITGRVTDAQNRPLPGASVILMVPAEEDAKVLRPSQAGGAGLVDNAGNYRLFNLAPGRYALAVTWANMGSGGRDAPVVGAYIFPSNTKPEIFTVTSGTGISGINFTLPVQSDYAVAGRVTGLLPKQTAAVALALRDRPTLAAALLQTTPEGEFRFERVAPGAYDLRAAAPMRGYGGTGALLGENALFGQVRVDVGGQNVNGAEIPLGPSGALKLTLQSTSECPAVPVSASLEPLENWAAMFFKPIEIKPNEESTVKDLAPGRYRLRITKPEGGCFGPPPSIVDSREAGAIAIKLQPPGIVEVSLPAPNAVTLSGIDDAGAPTRILPPVTVGPYRFEGIRPGRYRVQSGSMVAEVDVRPGATTQAVPQPMEAKQ